MMWFIFNKSSVLSFSFVQKENPVKENSEVMGIGHPIYCLLDMKNLRNVILACPVLLTFSFKIVGCDITVNLPSF